MSAAPESPPEDIVAEQSVLGSMMIEAEAVDAASALLSCADFSRPAHQQVFAAVLALRDAGRPVDMVTLPAELVRMGALDGIGGMAYLLSLFDAVPTAANVRFYAEGVAEKGRQRRLWEALQRGSAALGTGVKDSAALLMQLQSDLLRAQAPEGPVAGEWEPPVPFADASLPPFPLEALPPALADFVSEVATSVQVPLDMAAMMALGIVAAAGARTCLVQVGDTHQEPLNLFVAVVMEPGSRKSGTLDALAAPLREAERELTVAELPRITEAAEARAIEEKRLARLRDMAAKAKTGDEAAERGREVADLAGALTTVPAPPRLLADDVTPEAAAKMAGEQGGTLAIVSAEGGLFGNLGGRYQNGQPNLDLFLHGHAGEPHRVDRKGSPPVFIARTCLTVLLAIQPGVLAALSETPAFGERGLVARFLFSIPEDLVGTRFYSNRRIDPAARNAYHAAIKAIVGLPPAATEDDPGARHLLRLDGQALSLWAQYADDVERRQAEGGDLRSLKHWASKLAGAVARIAGGLHLAERAGRGCPWTRPIAPATVAAAWAVGEYLIPHAQAAYGDMGEGADAKTARRLLKWVTRAGLAEFSLRDCHQLHRSLPQTGLKAALSLLCERGFLRQAEGPKRPGAGRPKAPTYQVNPLIGDAQKDAQRPLLLNTQNTQNTQN